MHQKENPVWKGFELAHYNHRVKDSIPCRSCQMLILYKEDRCALKDSLSQ